MKKITALLSAIILLFSFLLPVSVNAQSNDEPFSMQLNENNEFTILHITDTQDDQYLSSDMLNLLKLSIEATKPDLIVFTGDLVEDKRVGDLGVDDESFREGVCVYNRDDSIDHNATLKNIEAVADAVFSVFEAYEVPFAVTLGNNDYKCTVTPEEWMAIYAKYPHCMVRDMSDDSEGKIDYSILIKDACGTPVYNLWMLDTGRGGVSAEQIAWYKTTAMTLGQTYGGLIPAVVFQHIHLPEIGNLFMQYGNTAIYGLNREIATGYNQYIYKPGESSEQFNAWAETGDVKAAFFGHQHQDGFTGVTQGIMLGFTYGAEFAKMAPHGFRTVTLQQNSDGETDLSTNLYRYTGNVKLGTAKVEMQENDGESSVLRAVLNFIADVFKTFISLF